MRKTINGALSWNRFFKGGRNMLHAADPTSEDPVRRSTAPHVNREIDHQTTNNIRRYANSSPEVIQRRIEELDKEWDIERALEANASTLALTGLVLGVTVNRKWLMLPGAVLSPPLQHSFQVWFPPILFFGGVGERTGSKSERKKYERGALLEGRKLVKGRDKITIRAVNEKSTRLNSNNMS